MRHLAQKYKLSPAQATEVASIVNKNVIISQRQEATGRNKMGKGKMSEWRATGFEDAKAGHDERVPYEQMLQEMIDEGIVSSSEEFSKQNWAQYNRGIVDYFNWVDEQASGRMVEDHNGENRPMSGEEFHEHQQSGGDWVWRR